MMNTGVLTNACMNLAAIDVTFGRKIAVVIDAEALKSLCRRAFDVRGPQIWVPVLPLPLELGT
jgi:hypothetical protein